MPNPFVIAEDLALKTYLAGMTVSDEKNMGRPVQVWFGYPDVEIRDQKFPFVTIDLLDIVPANDRQIQGRLSDADYQGTYFGMPSQYLTDLAQLACRTLMETFVVVELIKLYRGVGGASVK